MHIQFGGFVFYGGEMPAPTGFTVSRFSGWTGGPGVKRETVDRQGAPGSFRAVSYATDRVVSWGGRYHGSSLDDVQAMSDALSGAESRELVVTVAWPESRWVNATVDRVRFEPEGALPYADYQVDLWLPDPRKFGVVRESVSSATSANADTAIVKAWHRGNFDATPRFTVTASSSMSSGYQLKGKGRTFEVPGPLSVGQTDKVDFRSGTVRRNGVLVTGVVPRTFTVAGGEVADWRLWPLSGAGSATMHLPDTFI